MEINNELDREILDNKISDKDTNNLDNIQQWGDLDI